MPVYEYVCRSCGHHTEVSQSFKDAPLTTCPLCGGELRKLFSSPGILFKGSGFYRTDSRAPGRSGAEKGGKDETGDKTGPAEKTSNADKADKGEGATTTTKSDAKPAPAPAAKTGDVAKSA